MNWEAVGAVGELIGAAAVVISILYLAYQVSANAKATRASASFEATHSWSRLNQEVASQWSIEEHRIMRKSLEPSTHWDDINEDERAKLIFLIRALFQSLEGQYYLYRYGLLEKGQWEPRSSWAKGLIQLPFYKRFWEIEVDQRVYSVEFVNVISNMEGIKVGPQAVGGATSQEKVT